MIKVIFSYFKTKFRLYFLVIHIQIVIVNLYKVMDA